MSVATLSVYLVVGFAGVFAHWYKKWVEGSTQDTFKEYFVLNKKYTFYSFIGVVSMVGGAYSSVELSVGSCIALFFACLGMDSATNKDSTFDPKKGKYTEVLKTQQITIKKDKAEGKIEDIQDILDNDDSIS